MATNKLDKIMWIFQEKQFMWRKAASMASHYVKFHVQSLPRKWTWQAAMWGFSSRVRNKALAWRLPFGIFLSKLKWKHFSPMACIHDMHSHGARMALHVEKFLQRYNKNIFPPWRSYMTWRCYGAFHVKGFSFRIEWNFFSDMALAWRSHGTCMASTWRLHGAPPWRPMRFVFSTLERNFFLWRSHGAPYRRVSSTLEWIFFSMAHPWRLHGAPYVEVFPLR